MAFKQWKLVDFLVFFVTLSAFVDISHKQEMGRKAKTLP